MRHEQSVTDRSKRIVGMALQALISPTARNLHYYGRELFWTGRLKSAIEVLDRHVEMKNEWKTEQSKSLVYIGDCYTRLSNDKMAIESWFEAYKMEPASREPILRVAQLCKDKNDAPHVIKWAEASLQIPDADPYIHEKTDYRDKPHHLLCWAYGQTGEVKKKKEHLEKALAYA
jgi:tetratricopeptide (TPR) repeat protein